MLLSMFFVTNISGIPMDYYIGRVGLAMAHGPYSEAEVFFRMQSGLIDDSCLAWTAGMEKWRPVQDVINATMRTPPVPTKKSTKKLYRPGAPESFRLSRSKLENYLKCQRCFYLDRRLGIKVPSGPAFTLNIAVDELLKMEFDIFRKAGKPHPLMVENCINAVPWPDLANREEWRHNFTGIQHLHGSTNLELFGAVDDIWVEENGSLIVVDYKATSKAQEINSAEDIGGWFEAYKRQLEIYVWLLRQQDGCTVSDDIYWVYANADKKKPGFNGRLEFDLTLIAEKADDSWVEDALLAAHACLESRAIPEANADCKHCKYFHKASTVFNAKGGPNLL